MNNLEKNHVKIKISHEKESCGKKSCVKNMNSEKESSRKYDSCGKESCKTIGIMWNICELLQSL